MSTERPIKKNARPPFEPTQQQREFVSRMSGMRMTVTDVCKVIGISRRTAYKYFRPELESGSAKLHALVANQFVKAIKSGSPWAIQCALRNLQRFRFDRYDKGAVPFLANNDDPTEIKITFHPGPGNKKPEDAAIDVTPAAYENAQPDYSKPAIEPPRERTRTAFGAIHEAPRHEQNYRPEHPSYESQVGEPRPSIFDKPKHWMR
jgi:hypothetical protein